MNTVATTRRPGVRWAGLASGLVVLIGLAGAVAATRASAPLACNQGPKGQHFDVAVTVPERVEAGRVYTIRLDGYNSGKISHFGLNHLHDMTAEYILPAGVAYVDGSAKLVPGTGTPNVLVAPRVSHRAGVVTMRLPGKVENGTDYTPPSLTLQVRAIGAPGSTAVLSLGRFQLKANAFLVGDLDVSCDPTPRPYPIGATLILGSAPAAPIR
jgi:hypothetical protein